MKFTGLVGGRGEVHTRLIPGNPGVKPAPARFDFKKLLQFAYPQKGLERDVNHWREQNWFENVREAAYRLRCSAMLNGILSAEVRAHGELYVVKIFGDGRRLHLGVASLRLVTDAGVGYLRDCLTNTSEAENLKYHGIGTGTTNEAQGDTALVTELTTEYNPNSTRATGSLTTNGANVFRTIGTNTLDSGTPAITEHGIFSAASSGTLLDRSKFTAINLVGANGDGLQTTYDLTLTAGG